MMYVSPDGRSFTVSEHKCLHTNCWQARCQCGELLTRHDFDPEGARRCAVHSLMCDDKRKGFGHAVCRGAVS